MKHISKLFAVAATISCGLLAACDDDDDELGDDLALLRVVHAAPGAPPVDVFVEDSSRPLATIAYGEASPYVPVSEGNTRLVVRAAGTDTIVLRTDDIDIDEGDRITAIAAGEVASTDPANAFRVLPFYEEFGPDSGEARVVVVHASPDAPTVDIDVGDDATAEIEDLERFEATAAEGVPLAADLAQQIGIRANDARVTAFTTPTLAAGDDLFVIATGLVSAVPRDPLGFSLLVVGPQGVITRIEQNPIMYMLHASPDAPPIDVRTDAGALLSTNLVFGELQPAQVPPGSYMLVFSPTGTTTTAATARVTDLEAGERYLAIVTGMLTPIGGEPSLHVVTYAEQFLLDAMPRLRVIHASPDAPGIDIATVEQGAVASPPLIEDLEFLESTPGEGLAVPAAAQIPIAVSPADSQQPVATFVLDTSGSPRAFIVAAGALTPAADEQGFRLISVDTAASPWTSTRVPPAN